MRAILSNTATGDIKSKVINTSMCVLSFDCYISPSEFAKLIENYSDREFDLTITTDSSITKM